ncbi:MAG: bifunctional glycosyltransferase/CDP-glycerol:glycerophosphate glycerophosphotransferase [Intrasporangium sp.]|uniref:bifunctional glycosyltransferase/CDP-glycerol:glycerophosphate glycerophosphotransferase n=1 Tax=Intrasporangium sp. TaxID=1925024 RepID=UPI003F7D9E92
MTAASTQTPDVTVVVIVYNDAKRLGTAVRSVLRQTLRNVEVVIADDASTDSTPQVAAELSRLDTRVRYVRLPENSGGCGAPRNAGVAAAHGTHVMFLDSDDRLERHACKNLLEALEDHDADFSMGLVRREYMNTKRQTLWYPQFFEERRVLSSIEEWPELIEETLSVNKLYRRDFLLDNHLRFPEDIHYEDQVFTIQAYTKAKRIAIIPENVYIWRIFPHGARKSISNQRHRLDNFQSRLEAHRRIDEYLHSFGSEVLKRTKDLKFLQHDMRLYLSDSIVAAPTFTTSIIETADRYLRDIPRDRYEQLPSALRAAYGMAFRGDPEGLRRMMLLDRRNVMAPMLVQAEGGLRWTTPQSDPSWEANHPADEPENAFLRAEENPLIGAPFGTFHLHHEVVEVTASRRGVEILGVTHDNLRKLTPNVDWALSVVVRRERRPGRLMLPVEVLEHSEGAVTWALRIPRDSPIFSGLLSERWHFNVIVRRSEREINTSLLWPPALPEIQVPLRITASMAHANTGRLGSAEDGGVVFSVESASRGRERLLRAMDRRVLGRIRTRRERLRRRRTVRTSSVIAAARKRSLDPRLVLFEANMGTVYADSPKYVYEKLRTLRPELRFVWVLPEGHQPPHPDCKVVQRGSREYLDALARATYLVDNQTFPAYVRKRPGQHYLQTWHGIPLKKMGKDVLGHAPAPLSPETGVGAWDQLVIPNRYFEEVFVPAFDFRGELLRYGTPRNDPLVNGSLSRSEARHLLDLPEDANVILYAPTFREETRLHRTSVKPPFDVGEILDRLGPDTYLLMRPHYLNRISIPAAHRHRAVDVRSVEDVNLLYMASDMLVTDYSSVMFDYALLRRPMIFHTYDYDEYVSSRGTYFDLRAVGPGPFTSTTDELVLAVERLRSGTPEYKDKYEEFLETYCGDEDGGAAERAALALLERGGVL